jgi:hypothetical protein
MKGSWCWSRFQRCGKKELLSNTNLQHQRWRVIGTASNRRLFNIDRQFRQDTRLQEPPILQLMRRLLRSHNDVILKLTRLWPGTAQACSTPLTAQKNGRQDNSRVARPFWHSAISHGNIQTFAKMLTFFNYAALNHPFNIQWTGSIHCMKSFSPLKLMDQYERSEW